MVPVVSMVLGSVAGLPAVQAAMCHFNIMVKDTTQVFVAGPAVVKASQGIDITKEQLGNEDVQVRKSGRDRQPCRNEEDAFRQVRRFLSYLPTSVWEMPARVQTDDDPSGATSSCCRSCHEYAPHLRRPQAARSRARQGIVLRNPAAVRPRARHRPCAGRRLSGRRDGQQSALSRRRDGQGRRREDRAPRAAVRHLSSADRLPLRRARLHDRPRGGAERHSARRCADGGAEFTIDARRSSPSSCARSMAWLAACTTAAARRCIAASPGRQGTGAPCTSKAA